jgi:carbamoyltransferase
MIVLGIWGYSADSPAKVHDSGAALVHDGRTIAAISEERLTRKKCEGSFPVRSIQEVLRIANIAVEEIDAIALAGLSPFARSWKMLQYICKTYRETGILMPNRILYSLLTAKKLKRVVPSFLKGIRVFEVDHHEAHASSAYYTCPWEDATVITLDGIGDSSTCGSVSVGRRGILKKIREFNGYYSPGILYTFITQHFGFKPSRHEGKITGLAAYGAPETCYERFKHINRYDQERHDFFSEYIPRLFKARDYDHWEMPIVDDLLNEVQKSDVAAALQKLTEDTVTSMVRDAVEMTGIRNVALSGGVFGNVKVNQRIRELDCVDDVYVQPAMSDGGLALGAAMNAWARESHRRGEDVSPLFQQDVYLGPEFTNEEIQRVLDKYHLRYRYEEHPEKTVAELLKEKKIVGHFSGRMEYGPRALGNRSILADPTDQSINNWLNDRLKRTEFMPFAPSILEEDAGDYYAGWVPSDVAGRFMTMTYDVNPSKIQMAPAVAHIDRTARPQVVRKQDNPTYHSLISEYKKLTGLPLIINTSFNMHEEPIVCSPEDAIRSYLAGSVDVLVLENQIVENRT